MEDPKSELSLHQSFFIRHSPTLQDHVTDSDSPKSNQLQDEGHLLPDQDISFTPYLNASTGLELTTYQSMQSHLQQALLCVKLTPMHSVVTHRKKKHSWG